MNICPKFKNHRDIFNFFTFIVIKPETERKMPQDNYEIIEFSKDGAWCWFQDPRAIYIEGKYKKTYAQWITHKGRLQCGSYDHSSNTITHFTLKENWDKDDHNVGSFLILQDNRIMVYYARHNKPGLYCRTTKYPEDISTWEDEITITNSPKVTYSHPIYLKNEKKFFVF